MQLTKNLLATVLVVVGLSTYALSFGNGLFWDDDDFILHNAYIQDAQYLPKLFSENVIAGSGLVSNYWRPVLLLVFSAEWHLWGEWAPGWHMVNTGFHVVNGLLLFWLLQTILNVTAEGDKSFGLYKAYRTYIAFFVALIFLVHPVQVEAVAYANSLGDSLSVFFMFVGIWCFQKFLRLVSYQVTIQYSESYNLIGGTGAVITKTRNNSYKAYTCLGASVLCYLLALMSKETAIVMPGLLALMALRNYKTYKPYIIQLLPFVAVIVTYLILRATTLNFKNSFNLYDQSNVFTDSLWVRLLTFCKIIVEYVKIIFWPAHLRMERGLAFATSAFDPQVILGVLIIIGLFVTVWWFWRRNFLISFGILWFFIAMVPTSNILVPINGLVYEHWLYVPVVGAAAALAGLVSFWADRLYRNGRTYKPYIIIAVVVLTLLCLIARTIIRIQDWREPVVFYKQTLKFAPKDYKILNNLGMVLANKGDLQESINYYNLAIAEDSRNPIAYHNLANTYAGLGDLNLAVEYYKKALEQDPRFLYSYGKLIQVYDLLGRWGLALGVLDRYETLIGKTQELEQARVFLNGELARANFK